MIAGIGNGIYSSTCMPFWEDRKTSTAPHLKAAIGGIVLCGGRSSRMGRPKAWLPVGGELMLQRIVRIVREVVGQTTVVGAVGQELPELPVDVMIARDEIEGRGPLQGLACGIQSLAGQADIVYLSSCDVPLLQPAFVRRVVSLLESAPEAAIAIPRVEGRFHPLAAAYRSSALPSVRELLANDQLRVMTLLDRLPTRVLGAHELEDADPQFDSLRNVNTPEEYEWATERLRTRGLNLE